MKEELIKEKMLTEFREWFCDGYCQFYDILTIPTHDLIGLSDRPIFRYNTYEEALEAGLQEALKLI